MVKRKSAIAVSSPFHGNLAKQKKLRSLSAEALTSQKLRDCHREFLDEGLADVVINPATGMTLREELHKDIVAWQTGQHIIFGPHYHDNKRAIFRNSSNIHERLAAGPDGGDVRPALLQAMIALVETQKPKRGKILAFMECCTDDLSKAEVCGCLRFMVGLKIGCKKIQLPCILKCMDWLCRCNIMNNFPVQVQICHGFLSAAVMALWRGRPKGQDKKQFAHLNLSYLKLVMPDAALVKVMKTPVDSYHTVTSELVELIQSGPMGKVLFDGSMAIILAMQVQDIINHDIDNLLSTAPNPVTKITKTAVDKARAGTLGKLQALEGIDLLPEARQVTLRYGNKLLEQQPIMNLPEQVELQYASCVRALAVKQELVPRITCETIFTGMELDCLPHKATISPCAVAKAKEARQQLNAIMADTKTIGASDELMETVTKQALKLTLVDASVKCDLAIVRQLAGDAAVIHAVKSIEALFPTAEKEATPEVVLNRIEQWRSSDQSRIAPRAVQGLVTHIAKLIEGLVEERIIDIKSAASNPQLAGIMKAFEHFVRCPHGKTELTGGKAIAQLVVKAQAAVKDCKLHPDMVKELRLYHWLVPANLSKEVKLVCDAAKAMKHGSRAKPNLPLAASTSKTASTSGAKTKDSAVSAAMKMFA